MSVASGGIIKNQGQPTVILNGCLAHVKYLMLARDKSYIENEICAKYDLQAIKVAREIIVTYSDGHKPDFRYVYQGPNAGPNGPKTPRDKAVHALDMLLTKMNQLDQTTSPIFACPSNDIHIVTSSVGPSDSDRLDRMERDVTSLLEMKDSIDDMKRTMTQMILNKIPPPSAAVSAVFPDVTEKIQRVRSESIRSVKRSLSSDSEMETGNAAGDFTIPKVHAKRNQRSDKRRKLSTKVTPTFASVVSEGATKSIPTKSIPTKKNFKWGSSTEATTVGFSGAVPDAFIYRCDPNTKPEVIKNHLINKGIKVNNVELKSHKDATTRSFRVSVATAEDFDLLISGEYIPRYVKIKQYIHYSQKSGDKDRVSTRKPAYVYQSRKASSSPVTNSVTLLNNLCDVANEGESVMLPSVHNNPTPKLPLSSSSAPTTNTFNLLNELRDLADKGESVIQPSVLRNPTLKLSSSRRFSIDNLLADVAQFV